jgi:hypothetical protein
MIGPLPNATLGVNTPLQTAGSASNVDGRAFSNEILQTVRQYMRSAD